VRNKHISCRVNLLYSRRVQQLPCTAVLSQGIVPQVNFWHMNTDDVCAAAHLACVPSPACMTSYNCQHPQVTLAWKTGWYELCNAYNYIWHMYN